MTLDLQHEIRLAEEADTLLASEAFNNVTTHIREQALTMLASSQPDEIGFREQQYNLVRAIDEIDTHLVALSSGGTVARKQLEALNNRIQ